MIRKLTKKQIDLIAHTIGNTGYRNHFCVDEGHKDMETLLGLVTIGMMNKRPSPFMDGSFSDDVIFSVTVGGALAYLEIVQARLKGLEEFLQYEDETPTLDMNWITRMKRWKKHITEGNDE